jgi:hypothetical protein
VYAEKAPRREGLLETETLSWERVFVPIDVNEMLDESSVNSGVEGGTARTNHRAWSGPQNPLASIFAN